MSIELIMCAVGLFLSYWVNYGFGKNNSEVAYAFPIFFQMVFAAVTMILVPALPESPRWLVAHGKLDKAIKVLVGIGEKEDTVDSPDIKRKMI
jgi:hypothetical protein